MTNDRGRESLSLSETTRLEAFSDGVFAIAITLLILEIKVPPSTAHGSLGPALARLWPSYLAYLASFMTIGVMWVNHHRLFTLIQKNDDGLMLLNLLLLLGISWIPFPTALLAEHLLEEIGQENLFGNLDDALNRARRILGLAEEAPLTDIEPTVERERSGEHAAMP